MQVPVDIGEFTRRKVHDPRDNSDYWILKTEVGKAHLLAVILYSMGYEKDSFCVYQHGLLFEDRLSKYGDAEKYSNEIEDALNTLSNFWSK